MRAFTPISDAYHKYGTAKAIDINPSMLESLREKGFKLADDVTLYEVLALLEMLGKGNGKIKQQVEGG